MSLTSYRAAPPRDVFLQGFRCSPVFLAFVRPRRRCLLRADGAAAPRDVWRLRMQGPCRIAPFWARLSSYLSELSLFRSGGDLLSHVLRRSTIGVGTLIGRVRDGIGSLVLAVTTRPEKRPGQRCRAVPKHQGLFQGFVYVLLTISGASMPCCYRIRSSQSGN